MSRVTEQDYFLKNFISKSLAIIASKENKDNFDNLIGIIIENINNNIQNQDSLVADYLRLLLNILKETDNTVYYITGSLIPVIMRVFVLSNVNFICLFNLIKTD